MEEKKIVSEIDSELKFIQLFNYEVIRVGNANCWIIFDEKKENVGYIQKKKIRSKKPQKNLPTLYGYVMNIDSNLVKYNGTRCEKSPNQTDMNDYKYKFAIKVSEVEYAHVELNMGNRYPGITVWSEEYGYMNFFTTREKLYLDFKSETKNYNIEETIVIADSRIKKQYSYDVAYCSKDTAIEDHSNNFFIEFEQVKNNKIAPLRIRQLAWKNNKLIDDYSVKCKGFIEDAIRKHKMGLDSLSHFKFLLDKIIPSDTSVVDLIVSSIPREDGDLISLFFEQEVKNAKVLKKIQKLKNYIKNIKNT